MMCSFRSQAVVSFSTLPLKLTRCPTKTRRSCWENRLLLYKILCSLNYILGHSCPVSQKTGVSVHFCTVRYLEKSFFGILWALESSNFPLFQDKKTPHKLISNSQLNSLTSVERKNKCVFIKHVNNEQISLIYTKTRK